MFHSAYFNVYIGLMMSAHRSIGLLCRSSRTVTRVKPGCHPFFILLSPARKLHIPYTFSQRRGYRFLAEQRSETQSTSRNPAQPIPSLANEQEKSVSIQEQRRKDWEIIKRLLVHIWPANNWGVKGRVLFGLGLLVTGKV